MALAISSGSTILGRSEFSIDLCLRSSDQGSVQAVRVKPGATAFTRISGASARAKHRVWLTIAALELA